MTGPIGAGDRVEFNGRMYTVLSIIYPEAQRAMQGWDPHATPDNLLHMKCGGVSCYAYQRDVALRS